MRTLLILLLVILAGCEREVAPEPRDVVVEARTFLLDERGVVDAPATYIAVPWPNECDGAKRCFLARLKTKNGEWVEIEYVHEDAAK